MEDFRGFYRNKKVLVTGHTGFKGAWLCEWLLSMGAEVTGFSIDIPTTPSLYEALDLPRRLTAYEGDICNRRQLHEVFSQTKPEVVFHLAAQSLVRRSYDEPIRTFETNVMGTLQLLDVVREFPLVQSVVIVTSDKVYENKEVLYGYRESDTLGGKDPYSASKACAETATRSYILSYFQGAKAPSIGTARAGNVIGGGDWAKDRIIPDCVRSWSESQAVLLRNPDSVRPWQHVLEPLGGYLLLAERLATSRTQFHGEAFNFGPVVSHCKTVKEIVTLGAAFWPGAKWESSSKQQDCVKPEAGFLQVNCDKAYHRLSWSPLLDLRSTLQWTVDWYRKYYENRTEIAALTQGQIEQFESRLTIFSYS